MTYLCTCRECGASLSFDPKHVGETVACPACNQDLKLIKETETRNEPAAEPEEIESVVHKINETGFTECCDTRIFDLPRFDRCTENDSLVTCKGVKRDKTAATEKERVPLITERAIACPPVIAHVQRKRALLGALVALGFFFASIFVMWGVVNFCINIKYQYDLHGRDSLQSAAGQEYGVRDHSTSRTPRSDAELRRIARSIGIADGKATDEFIKGYKIGWNLIGQY